MEQFRESVNQREDRMLTTFKSLYFAHLYSARELPLIYIAESETIH